MPYKDPDKQKEAQQASYKRNRKRQAQSDKARKQSKQSLVRSLMTPCEECGAFDVAFMDWHHLDPGQKVNSISAMIKSATVDVLMAELEKCICLCSNCHRKLHFY